AGAARCKPPTGSAGVGGPRGNGRRRAGRRPGATPCRPPTDRAGLADPATMTDPTATPRDHKAHAPKSIGCWVLTVSDTKTPETDTSGALIRELLNAAGHRVVGFTIVSDEPADVQRVVRAACGDERVQAVIVTGGTGITSRDSTFE